ncbi:hypothetical protein TNCT_118931 [Trichonephila clavata]|uniref:Transposase n=1 Tax=Trichonephila clavata TaxID=2740835 RepID=A0A8X6IIS1_TRICU|nr:hypothetical protein TNCT_118931 [Trichonephila clavata]
MDAPKEETREVVRCLTVEGVSQQEISRLIQMFTLEERESCKGDSRLDQSHLAITPDSIAQVDELIRQERGISIDELAEPMNISHCSVHSIIHDNLGYRLFCTEWISKPLSNRQMALL